MTLREACVRAGAWLEANGVEEGRSHAERLLLHALGIDRAALLFGRDDLLPEAKGEEWRAMVRRRATGEPLQYVIGEEWFYGRPFAVTPAVLIPRPETELLVEAVLAAADRLWPAAAGEALPEGAGSGISEQPADPGCSSAAVPTVVDVGTGSGAIAVTLAAQRPAWRLFASDLSPDALEVARANAARHGAAGRVSFTQGDLLAPFVASGGRIDVLVSNPPYIPAADMPELQREVRDFEPHLALVGGTDGLDPYRRMLEQLPLLPAMPRIVAFELGMGQPRIVAEMMREMGAWDDIRIIVDYNGIERHIVAINSAAESDGN
ncbi:peptide chain release factor N(5)-glutamine methyltransferase [Paenibacillus sp. LHD-117]|uniref:peptide chain release factor N(5)-glutamine methyltransferase n=1 Tax=Paenibacillus sp. LHD-117 TaxID=3071412 RepID=UPI0027E0986C|nr:peptide chain release factor N(5)-glutamine methyltransferase [Paenibacillus sp. LHD-117]MDQ6420997.1 peptide chain release factor N(5)-glutamine methyltransferase [Paenibacillus sp. LHD-117]